MEYTDKQLDTLVHLYKKDPQLTRLIITLGEVKEGLENWKNYPETKKWLISMKTKTIWDIAKPTRR